MLLACCAAHAREKVGPGRKVPGTSDEGDWTSGGRGLETDSLVEEGEKGILLVRGEVGERHLLSSRFRVREINLTTKTVYEYFAGASE